MIVDPITEDELCERLHAPLATQGLALHRGTLDGMAHTTRGRFFITRLGSEEVAENDVNIEDRARRMGVLKDNEALVPAHGAGY